MGGGGSFASCYPIPRWIVRARVSLPRGPFRLPSPAGLGGGGSSSGALWQLDLGEDAFWAPLPAGVRVVLAAGVRSWRYGHSGPGSAGGRRCFFPPLWPSGAPAGHSTLLPLSLAYLQPPIPLSWLALFPHDLLHLQLARSSRLFIPFFQLFASTNPRPRRSCLPPLFHPYFSCRRSGGVGVCAAVGLV